MPLTALQERFAEEYLKDLNATQAAKRAGSKADQTGVAGYEFLRNPQVADRIAELKLARSQETKIDAAWLLTRLAAEALADVADLYTPDGALKPVQDWPLIWRVGLVQSIEVEELFDGAGKDREQIGVVRKIKLSDRVKRLELIGRHIGVAAFRDTLIGALPFGSGAQEDIPTLPRDVAKAIMAILAEAVRPQIEGRADAEVVDTAGEGG